MPRTNQTIACPICECGHCPVSKTQHYEGSFGGVRHVITKRIRKCKGCGANFHTVEQEQTDIDLGELGYKPLREDND